jgi:hypothetical protein
LYINIYNYINSIYFIIHDIYFNSIKSIKPIVLTNNSIAKYFILNKLDNNINYYKFIIYSLIIIIIINALFGFESESIIAITLFLSFTNFILYFNYKLYKFFEYKKFCKINLIKSMKYVFINLYLNLYYKLIDIYMSNLVSKFCYYNDILKFIYIKLQYIKYNSYFNKLIYVLQIYFEIFNYLSNFYLKTNNFMINYSYMNLYAYFFTTFNLYINLGSLINYDYLNWSIIVDFKLKQQIYFYLFELIFIINYIFLFLN